MTLELSDIQGLVFYSYVHLPYAAYLPLQLRDATAARAWLKELIASDSITNADRRTKEKLPNPAVNLALSPSGLRKLGLSAHALETFAREFVGGMENPDRSRVLGDVGDSAPERWHFGNRHAPVDALLCLFAESKVACKELTS